ncbi:hypothetical protein ACI2K4_35280 [Micromonospora sp. NPDC050397]|uniref:hypothetical protein n=1 Tax=Micromonospora sp. NPDC050397 TaxID=3364279 RepID=UPI0038504DF3
MITLLETLGGRIAERWLQLLVLPGALYLLVAFAALRHGTDIGGLTRDIDKLAASPAARSVGATVAVLIGLAAGAALVGLAVRALGSVVERIWMVDAAHPVTRLFARRRLRRWESAERRYQSALLAAGRAHVARASDATTLAREAERLALARNRIGMGVPRRAFWVGDRIASADLRVLSAYHLDLVSAWPRLWLVLPDPARAALQTAWADFSSATRLVVWGVAYLPLGIACWPALPVGAAMVVVGWRRGRASGAVLAELLESAVDVHGRDLASAMGVDCPQGLTRDAGESLTSMLRKDS